MPGYARTTESGFEDFRWLGSTHAIRNARTMTGVSTAFTGTEIVGGTPVAVTGETITPWGGTGKLGFVLRNVTLPLDTADDTSFNAPVLMHGIINVANLPVALSPVPEDGNFVFITGSDA